MDATTTLKHWGTLGDLGATNLVRLAGVSYSWDANPREQKNGALVGRVYEQRPGENTRDIGHYKIAPDGEVVEVPAQLAAVLVEPMPLSAAPGFRRFEEPAEIDDNQTGSYP